MWIVGCMLYICVCLHETNCTHSKKTCTLITKKHRLGSPFVPFYFGKKLCAAVTFFLVVHSIFVSVLYIFCWFRPITCAFENWCAHEKALPQHFVHNEPNAQEFDDNKTINNAVRVICLYTPACNRNCNSVAFGIFVCATIETAKRDTRRKNKKTHWHAATRVQCAPTLHRVMFLRSDANCIGFFSRRTRAVKQAEKCTAHDNNKRTRQKERESQRITSIMPTTINNIATIFCVCLVFLRSLDTHCKRNYSYLNIMVQIGAANKIYKFFLILEITKSYLELENGKHIIQRWKKVPLKQPVE